MCQARSPGRVGAHFPARAVAAQVSGHFDREIVGVQLPDDGGELRKDDGPRPGTTIEKLPR
jgi:acetyl-CoA acyltransferase